MLNIFHEMSQGLLTKSNSFQQKLNKVMQNP